MLSFHQKRTFRKVFASRFVHVALLIACAGMAWSAYGRYVIAKEMADKRIRAEQEVVELENRRATLEDKVRYITNERGIEAEMRRQFDIARDGETVVIILDEEEKKNE